MNKRRLILITVLLSLGIFSIIQWHLLDSNNNIDNTTNIYEPNYQSKYTTTLIYNSVGKLNYKLIADHIHYFTNQQVIWFIHPVATSFHHTKNWTITADTAKLIKGNILYLYGNIKLDSIH